MTRMGNFKILVFVFPININKQMQTAVDQSVFLWGQDVYQSAAMGCSYKIVVENL